MSVFTLGQYLKFGTAYESKVHSPFYLYEWDVAYNGRIFEGLSEEYSEDKLDLRSADI